MKHLALALAVVAACGKSDAKPAAGSAAKPAERDPAAAQKLLASIVVPKDWRESPADKGVRSFGYYDTQIDPPLTGQTAASLDALTELAKPGKVHDGWPFWSYRFTTITDRGSSGDAYWIVGALQENQACGDHGCPDDGWQDGLQGGFVVYRTKGDLRVRCAAHGIHATDNRAIKEAFAWCKTGAWL
jgi:hypothetical protein